MKRPLFKARIDDLEKIFAESSKNTEALTVLRNELGHRNARRAVALRVRVERALAAASGQPRKTSTAAGSRPLIEPTVEATPVQSLEARRGSPTPSRGSVQNPAPRVSPAMTGEVPASSIDALLSAWTVLEVLEPQPLPRPEQFRSFRQQLIRQREHPAPWTAAQYRQQRGEKGVYWHVYLGELDLAQAFASLLDLFPDESPERAPVVRGATTMAVVVLDAAGRPVPQKVFLSSFAWGYGQVRSGRLEALAEFPQAERLLSGEIDQRLVRMDEEGEILPVTAEQLSDLTEWLAERLGLPLEQLALDPVSVRVPVWRRGIEAPEPELLNSFFLTDLQRVREAGSRHDLGSALLAYLRGTAQREQVDVGREPVRLEAVLAPERLPLSRWPVRGLYPLVMMQQAAVSHAVTELSDGGLVGINGPPGTGKTTLLRDVIAKVVLDRADAMADFDDPQDAFTHVTSIKLGRGFGHMYRLDERLLGHEIVVASSNNKAVENISREIPAREAVEENLDPPAQYFASVAERVLGHPDDGPSGESFSFWGIAAAVLGNSANRSAFTQAFWWDKSRSFQAYLRGIVDGWDPASMAGEEEPPEVLSLEMAPRDRSEALARWRRVRARYLEVRACSLGHRERLEEVRCALRDRAEIENELGRVAQEIGALEESVRGLDAARQEHGQRHDAAVARVQGLEADRDGWASVRPSFWARLFRTRSYRDWQSRMQEILAALLEARTAEATVAKGLSKARLGLRSVEERLGAAEARHTGLERRVEAIRALLEKAKKELGERLPDSTFWSRAEEDRQKLSPWLEEGFQSARAALFVASFELHRAFIDAAAPRMRHNLGVAMELLRGRKLTEAQEPARRSLWASLFLAVPVISTTFASVSRMFGPLGREQLGWLLIDEAGQAVPQAAVGAMWRARRVVVIGDPMQIQPVVTMPQRLTDAILTQFNVDPGCWSAPLCSVQSLADRVSWLGTTIRHAQGETWVGSPLRVHRRCQEPMFGISNRVAYDGLMVQATPSGSSAIGEVLGGSGWFHVESSEPGHWSRAEGELAARLLAKLFQAGLTEPGIFFITPFRLVQDRLRERLRPLVDGRVSSSSWQWVKDNVGTVHTFQGKEAEAVVLVLGAPSAEAAGARRWAGGEPNLLNVAVSRAKKRLYVVGDRTSWRDAGVFRSLATALPQRR